MEPGSEDAFISSILSFLDDSTEGEVRHEPSGVDLDMVDVVLDVPSDDYFTDSPPIMTSSMNDDDGFMQASVVEQNQSVTYTRLNTFSTTMETIFTRNILGSVPTPQAQASGNSNEVAASNLINGSDSSAPASDAGSGASEATNLINRLLDVSRTMDDSGVESPNAIVEIDLDLENLDVQSTYSQYFVDILATDPSDTVEIEVPMESLEAQSSYSDFHIDILPTGSSTPVRTASPTPTPSPDPTPLPVVATQSALRLEAPNFVPSGRHCAFCQKNGEIYQVYESHYLRNRHRILCPILRNLVCDECGATGDNAHTRRYCPMYNGAGSERVPRGRERANDFAERERRRRRRSNGGGSRERRSRQRANGFHN